MPSPSDYETLSYEERIHRIGRLVLKGVTLAQMRREQASAVTAEKTLAPSPKTTSPTEPPPLELCAELLTNEEQAFLRRIDQVREIAPSEAAQFWRTSRATTSRRLARLEKAGWIVRHGATTAARYQFTAQAQAYLRQMWQAVQAPQPSKKGGPAVMV